MTLTKRLLIGMALASVFAGQAMAFADDEARTAILQLREQVKDLQQQLDVQQQAQLNFANHISLARTESSSDRAH